MPVTIPRISVAVNTLNEEKCLATALRSVQSWVDEIIVVDMYSDDKTVEVAEAFGARVFMHERMGFADPARAFALAQCTGDWILILDADELVPLAMSQRLREIAANDEADVVLIPWLNYICGAPLLHTGWGPSQERHERFFKRGFMRTSVEVHRFLIPEPNARILSLPYPPEIAIVHFNCLTVEDFIRKLNNYTTIEARQALDRGERTSPVRALFAAAKTFLGRYVYPQGYRDGWRGWYLSLFMAFYRLATHAKMREMQMYGSREEIATRYHAEAERLLAEYPPTVIPMHPFGGDAVSDVYGEAKAHANSDVVKRAAHDAEVTYTSP